eukprot:CAMPEP_0170160334 /NCGR_PEP_ID=MMETSP0033_2-20121228/73175_1 /TAXON_ID=195969 /ORGANISM="Dolichomastix tenuilepis, Strain CCMP3274" /LENGTH=60 /DNA_ID=CAMNT_0010397877 /DNA_START=6 /DNA_END=188 /DNA_ORIENTATION=-
MARDWLNKRFPARKPRREKPEKVRRRLLDYAKSGLEDEIVDTNKRPYAKPWLLRRTIQAA